jgi:Tfp pilus assembly protein PilP
MSRKNALVLTSVFLLAGVLILPAPNASFASAVPHEVVYKESRPMKNLVEDTIPAPSGAVQETEEEDAARYTYNPIGKTDPFKPFLAEQESAEEKKQRKPRTYLETLDLSQLELIAIIVGPKGNWAMVRDSKGVGHVIQKGTLIGTNSGIVYAVTDKEVVIREEYKDYKGIVQQKDVAKKLPSLE